METSNEVVNISEEKKSTYTDKHRQYYLEHKKQIYERDYAKGKYHRRYERKKEELRAKALARYYRKKEEKLRLEQEQNVASPAITV